MVTVSHLATKDTIVHFTMHLNTFVLEVHIVLSTQLVHPCVPQELSVLLVRDTQPIAQLVVIVWITQLLLLCVQQARTQMLLEPLMKAHVYLVLSVHTPHLLVVVVSPHVFCV